MYIFVVIFLLTVSLTTGQPGKCDQTPPQATVDTPSENKGTFQLTVDTKEGGLIYRPDQTYVLILTTNNQTRPFRWFMITVEDPGVDTEPDFDHRTVDVGSLKTLDTHRQSRYSERCYNSVENTDNSDKYRVEVHWVSPKQPQNDRKKSVRLRAMVAENSEVWYIGDNLTVVLEKDINKPLDSPPYPVISVCNLCSEARYEVIFKGKWSRMSHPRKYPRKPDDNGYSHLVGASHSYHYILWQPGDKASPGLKKLAEEADISDIEREIIDAMSLTNGTRTLIRGRRRHHPDMFEPSHSLFRVDRIHHLFSVLVAMKPSPDWFLGATKFELCTDLGWLEESEIPLYPWDAGTMDGISYESPTSVTQPVDSIDRVAVGSFNQESPFYQMNLNDLKPFALLQVRRLAVYPLPEEDCIEEEGMATGDDGKAEPQTLSLREHCEVRGEWGPCVPHNGRCGDGNQMRGSSEEEALRMTCQNGKNGRRVETRSCFMECNENNMD
ncbi:spondin-2-like [Aricia agestis]|uniref:spondin-2-like n=1 Tax=Aricia agestis TaxID=91739 RepID=UPI001C202A96|nr:spondin-2-like [Aricia agestis]